MTMEQDFRELLTETYERFKSVSEGKVADYIPALPQCRGDVRCGTGRSLRKHSCGWGRGV